MRVPLPWVLSLSFAVMGGVGWYGSRKADFLTPPREAKLAEIRARVESSLPQQGHPDDAVSAPAVVKPPAPPPPAAPPPPVIELGDLSSAPTLQEYSERSALGAAHLLDLAVLLEAKGEPQRALLAWERVLDTGKPNPDQSRTATLAINRLRPTLPDWNKNPATAIAIILHAGTSQKTAKTLTPALEQSARDLQRSSAGLLKITTSVTTSNRSNRNAASPAPIALWLTGPGKKNPVSTAVLTFTTPSAQSLRDDLLKSEFRLIREALAHDRSHTAPPALIPGENPLEALRSHITRRAWQELGTRLKRPAKKDESFAKKPRSH